MDRNGNHEIKILHNDENEDQFYLKASPNDFIILYVWVTKNKFKFETLIDSER